MKTSNRHERHIMTLSSRMLKRDRIDEEEFIEDFKCVSKKIAFRWFYIGMTIMVFIDLIFEWIIKPML